MGNGISTRLWLCAVVLGLCGTTMAHATGETTRVERHPYTLGMDAGHICEVGVGGVCLTLRPTDRFVTIDIQDVNSERADALYQYTDGYGAIHGTGAVCGTERLAVPDSATKLDIFLQTATLGALGCAATDGAAIATTGEVVATFEVGTPRMFPQRQFDPEQDCATQPPVHAVFKGVNDGGEWVNLDLIVLMDGVPLDTAKSVMSMAAKSYYPLGIRMKVKKFVPVTFTTDDAAYLNSQAKSLYGGYAPWDVDIVYTITTKDIKALNQAGVAGLADCIGGVRWANRAFAVGEIVPVLGFEPLPVTFYGEGSARVAAHEIGHLMGGQHEHANCVQGTLDGFSGDDPTPCTLMSNFADFVSERFGAVESAVVRGHAIRYAKP